jgi:hypothetical protein
MGTRVIRPVCVFLIVFGVARLAELADWSHLHDDVARMLGAGSATATALLVAGKAAELLFTALAVLALTRRRSVWLLVALAGWNADLALLSAVAAIYGDLGRLLEHGLSFIAFAGLLAVTYAFRGRPGRPGRPYATPTRRDLPIRGPAVTRQDLPVRGQDVTRQDLPTGGRRPRDA